MAKRSAVRVVWGTSGRQEMKCENKGTRGRTIAL